MSEAPDAEGLYQLVDLTDEEFNGLLALGAELVAKYGSRPSTPANLKSLVSEASDRARDELGLEIEVWLGNRVVRRMGHPILDGRLSENLSFSPVARVAEYDLERHVAQARAGVADKAHAEARAEQQRRGRILRQRMQQAAPGSS